MGTLYVMEFDVESLSDNSRFSCDIIIITIHTITNCCRGHPRMYSRKWTKQDHSHYIHTFPFQVWSVV